GAEELSGYGREEVIGRQGPVLYENEENAKKVMRRMREGDEKVSAFETAFRAKDGNLIPVLISASMLYDEEGREAGTVGFSKDLRERKQAEEKLRRAHDELREAYETLKRAQASAIVAEKLAALGRLTAGVTHEMLNPLQVVTLNLHMLIKAPSTPPEIVSQLREVEEHANRITKIVQDLLHFARHRPPERQPVDCNEAVGRTVDFMKHDLKLNDITVEANFEKALPAVSADPDQLRQVVLNLLTNARDAMPDGGRLLLRTNTVQVNGEHWVELRVEDTGSGIAPGHMEKLFDPFFTTKAEGEGTGLGLSICKGIVEAHGGAIWAENTSVGGVDFIVRLEIWGE
ncbi:ATP-binding protein, partial [Nitrospinae bacterium AH-259-F20]|nr:ATP-binding protein [Nitrospinae bacterium AH-259-F20]